MQKSDGSYWLAVWDDARISGPVTPTDIVVSPVPVTINLGFTANIKVFDPLTGITVIQTANGVSNVTVSVPDHPVLVEILPISGSTTAPPVNPPPGNLVGASFTVPGAETVTTGQTIAVTGIQFNDAAAGKAAGALALNVSSLGGKSTITDGTGKVLTGTGATPIFAQGTLAQLDAELATLSYTAGAKAGRDQLSITVTDQSGASFGVAVQIAVDGDGSSRPAAAVRTVDHRARPGNRRGRSEADYHWRADRRRLRRQSSWTTGAERLRHRRHHRHDGRWRNCGRGLGHRRYFRAGHAGATQRRTREPRFHSGDRLQHRPSQRRGL